MSPSSHDTELNSAIRESQTDPTNVSKACRLVTLLARINSHRSFDLLSTEQISTVFRGAAPELPEEEFAARLKVLRHLGAVPFPDHSLALYKRVASWPELWSRIFGWKGDYFEQCRLQDALISMAVVSCIAQSLKRTRGPVKCDLEKTLYAVSEFYTTDCTSGAVYQAFYKLQTEYDDLPINQDQALVKACSRLAFIPILVDPLITRGAGTLYTADVSLGFEGRSIWVSDSGMTNLSGENLPRDEATEFLLKEALTLVAQSTEKQPETLFKDLLECLIPWLCDSSHRFALNDEERLFSQRSLELDIEMGLEFDGHAGP